MGPEIARSLEKPGHAIGHAACTRGEGIGFLRWKLGKTASPEQLRELLARAQYRLRFMVPGPLLDLAVGRPQPGVFWRRLAEALSEHVERAYAAGNLQAPQ